MGILDADRHRCDPFGANHLYCGLKRAPMQRKKSKKTGPGSKSKRRGVHGLDWYARRKKMLSEFHRFSFATRRNFTPAQKAAITKKWNELSFVFDWRRRAGHVRLVKAPLEKTRHLRDRFFRTNKGVILFYETDVFKINAEKTDSKRIIDKLVSLRKDKPAGILPGKITTDNMTEEIAEELMWLDNYKREFGDLRDRQTVYIKRGYRLELFIPLLEGEKIDDLFRYVFHTLKPHSVALSVGKRRGNTAYSWSEWEGYRETLMLIDKEITDYQIRKGLEVESKFNGVHAVWNVGILKPKNR